MATLRASKRPPAPPAVPRVRSRVRVAGQVLWPAFLMAAVLEALIFVVVDPGELQWFGAESLGWPRQAVYTVTFGLCWLCTATSGALTALLLRTGDVDTRDPF